MDDTKIYDCAIVGGGLAGLCLSVQLAKEGFRIILFEKEKYPFHKVCGEYISHESRGFLEQLGFSVSNDLFPFIKKLIVTAPSGTMLKQDLPLGGFGVSRYKIDNDLKEIALKQGVMVMENCKVNDVLFSGDKFRIITGTGEFFSKTCCASFGKRSNLDVKWKRSFTLQPANKLNNLIAVKYHIETDFPADSIALHNFRDGYCGISKVEGEKYCLCYLTNAANLKNNGNDIEALEKNVLSQNPHLKYIFEHSRKIFQQPLSISQISFDKKSRVENHMLMIGDAAGMITPLCGNGMSMAMHGSKIAANHIRSFLIGQTGRDSMEKNYSAEWKMTFERRMKTGRFIQRFFGKPRITRFFVIILKHMPFLTRWLISQTHGKPFIRSAYPLRA